MLAVVMVKPKLLMLNEPSLGLAPLIVKEIFHIIVRLKQAGVAILLVEKNARAALQVADYAYAGNRVCGHEGGLAAQLASDPQIIAAYLGLAKKAV